MTLQNFLKSLKTVKKTLHPSTRQLPKHLPKTTQTTVSNNVVVSDPNFNSDQNLSSLRPDIKTHLTLCAKLAKAKCFTEVEAALKFLLIDGSMRYPFGSVVSSVSKIGFPGFDSRVLGRLFNLMMKVYSDHGMFSEVKKVFDYMTRNRVSVNEKTCTVHLFNLKNAGEVGLCVEFFYKMVVSGRVEVSVFSLTIAVDVVCRSVGIRMGRVLVEEMVSRGFKPNVITFNVLVDACCKRWNFEELDMVLVLMEKEGVACDEVTYKILVDGYSGYGKFKEAKRIVSEMHAIGFKVDAHLYNMIIRGYCRLGRTESAHLMFCKMTQRDVDPNCDTFCALISGLCKIGEMDVVKLYLDEMDEKGIEKDEIILNNVIDGFYRNEMVDEAFEFLVIMMKKGLAVDTVICENLISEFLKLNRAEEAKRLSSIMVKRGVGCKFHLFDTSELS